ncbi:MAG: hypothetical protein QOF10_5867, partial [Kribbellaceae bacterium]|nr:hypothetical protein [Kribbellaceae bacterium]
EYPIAPLPVEQPPAGLFFDQRRPDLHSI